LFAKATAHAHGATCVQRDRLPGEPGLLEPAVDLTPSVLSLTHSIAGGFVSGVMGKSIITAFTELWHHGPPCSQVATLTRLYRGHDEPLVRV
jgi:hypothetical protein